MMQQLANFIVDHDPMMVIRRTHDTVRYIRWAWNKDHADPIDEEELRLFLCDEHYGDLTDEQRAVARQGRDEMRSVYAELCVRLLQHEIISLLDLAQAVQREDEEKRRAQQPVRREKSGEKPSILAKLKAPSVADTKSVKSAPKRSAEREL